MDVAYAVGLVNVADVVDVSDVASNGWFRCNVHEGYDGFGR